MPDVKNSIILATKYEGAAVKQAIADLAKLKSAMGGSGGGGNAPAAQAQAASKAAAQQAASLGTVAGAATKADTALLRLAQAQARLQSAQGDAAGAAKTLETALTQVDRSSLAAVNATTQLTRAQNALAKSSKEAGAGAAVLPRTIAGLSHEAKEAVSAITGLSGSLATAGGAVAAVKTAFDLSQAAASAEAARASFDKMAASAGTSGQALLGELRAASDGTVAQADLIQNTNTALLLLGNDVATKLPALLQVARASAQATGQDVGFVFQSLVTGISRGSTELIDNAGITLSATEAYATYAASIGKSADELTKAERSQAILNGVLTAGQGIVKQSGDSADSAAANYQRFNAAVADAKIALGQLAGTSIGPLVEDSAAAIRAITDISQGAANLADIGKAFGGIVDQASNVVPILGPIKGALESISTGAQQVIASLDPMGSAFANVAAQAQAIGDATGITTFVDAAMNASTNAQTLTSALFGAASASDTVAYSAAAAGAATDAYALAAQGANPPTAELSARLFAGGGAFDAYAAAATNGATETQKSAELSAYDAQMKAAQTAELELAQAQAQALADAFIDANPNISASGAASAAAAAGMSPLIARLIEATLRAREAAGALAAFNALGGIGAAFGKGVGRLPTSPGMGAVGGNVGTGKGSTGGQGAGLGVGAGGAGGTGARIAAYQGPSPYVKPTGRGGRGGGGGGGRGAGGGAGGGAAGEAKKREQEAQQSAARLAQIEQQLGGKLADIDMATQEKLAAIDARAAEKRAEAARKLSEQISADASGFNFDETLNDFDLFNSELDDKQRAALEAREAAEANYQQRVAAAGEEARKIAADGDAEYAQEYYKIKKEQAERQKEIEERAAKANQDTNGEQADAVAAKAAEATAAAEAEAAREIAIAQAAAEQRKAAIDGEKNAAIAAAQEQRDAAVQAAQEAAAGLKNAADVGTAAVVAGYQRQMEAIAKARRAAEDYARTVKGLPAPPTTGGTTATTTPATTAPATGGLRAAQGGATQGIAAKGGAQQQGASAPSATPGTDLIATIQDALQIVIWLDGVAKDNAWNKANTLPQFVGRMQLAIQALNDIVAVHDIARTPVSPLDPETIRAMVKDMTEAVAILGNEATPALNALAQRVSIMANAAKLTTELLSGMAEFRKNIRGEDGKLAAPIPAEYIQALVDETVYAVDLFSKAFARSNYGADFRKGISEWVDNAGGVLDLLNNAADLGNALKEPSPPVTLEMMERLADTTERAVEVVLARINPLTAQERDGLEMWAEQAGAALDILGAAADLDANAADVDGTVLYSTLNNLADTSRDALAVIQARMQPLAAAEVAALKTWAESAGQALDVIGSAVSLAADIADLKGDGTVPIGVLQRLASTATSALQVVQGSLLPQTEEQAAALERWRDSSGAAVDTLSAVASLYGDVKGLSGGALSVDLLLQLADDAATALAVVNFSLRPQTEAQVEGLQRYADASEAATGVIQNAIDLRAALADKATSAPPTEKALLSLAQDNARTLRVIDTVLIPVTEQQVELYQNYGDAVESATGALGAALDLSADAFADYTSPSDAQLGMLAADAERIVKYVADATRVYDTKGLEAAQQFGDALGSIAGAFNDTLQFFGALATGDFALDMGRFAEFIKGSVVTLDGAATLAAKAATIPAGDLTALNNASAALTGYGAAVSAINAVPLNVPTFGGGGGGGATYNITNYITPQAGQDATAIAKIASDMTIAKIQQMSRGVR